MTKAAKPFDRQGSIGNDKVLVRDPQGLRNALLLGSLDSFPVVFTPNVRPYSKLV